MSSKWLYPKFISQTSLPDPVLQRFMWNRGMKIGGDDVPTYGFLGLCGISVGGSMAIFLRLAGMEPHHTWRTADKGKPELDRQRCHAYSLPYYNCRVRNWACRFWSTFIDNEPDYCLNHPLGIRPNRRMGYNRLPFIFSSQRYLINDPNYKKTLHSEREKYFKSIGYYGKKKKASKNEEPLPGSECEVA
eukprot:GHVL01032442.1.p1 GENE.GHVL01032442.1~~GHVL01032442.1.p1  ORF type:complete len:189 (+),score=15.89 GHVL01032442.1:55-621(+)